jgi:alpha-L-fucosidase 2
VYSLASYPNNVIAIKLSASENAKITCTVSAVNPYLRNTNEKNHSFRKKDESDDIITNYTRNGNTVAEENTITLSGNIPSFSLNYEGQIKVINDGGIL